MLEIQVLVATTNQTDYSLLEKMNIQTQAIVGNQCSINQISEFDFKGNKIKWLSFNERGVGLNRNNALMRADKDVCLIADDDMVYYDGYSEIVEKAFKENPKASVIIFNIDEENGKRHVNKKTVKVNKHNFGRYGAVRIAFKREPIFLNGISFNLSFGGGTEYGSGEDTLFIKSCLDSGLKVVAVPYSIAKLKEERKSTWFNGYNEKYFLDKGVLYYFINKRLAKLICLYNAFKHRKSYKEFGAKKAYKLMKQGVKKAKKLAK